MSKLRYPLPQPADRNPAPSSRRLAGFGAAVAAFVIAGAVWPVASHNPQQIERTSRILTPPPVVVVAPKPVVPFSVKAFEYLQIELGSRRTQGAGEPVVPVQVGVLFAVAAHDPTQFELPGRVIRPAAFTAPPAVIPPVRRAVADYDPITVLLESRLFAGAGEPTQYPPLLAQRAIDAHHPIQRELSSRRIQGAGAPVVAPPVRAFRPDPIPERVARDLESRRIQGAGAPPPPLVQAGILRAISSHDPTQHELVSRRFAGAGQAPPPGPAVRALRPVTIPDGVARELGSRQALVGRVDLFGPPAGRPPYGVILFPPVSASVPDTISAQLAAHELTAPPEFGIGHVPAWDGVYFFDGVILYGDYAIGKEPAHGVVLTGNLGVVLT